MNDARQPDKPVPGFSRPIIMRLSQTAQPFCDLYASVADGESGKDCVNEIHYDPSYQLATSL